MLLLLLNNPNIRSEKSDISSKKNTIALYDSLYIKFHELYFENSDFSFSESQKLCIQELYNSDLAKNDPIYNARIKYLEAFVYSFDTLSDYNKVISLVNEALPILTKEDYPREYAKLLLLKGIAYVNTSVYYVDAYKYSNEIFKLLNKQEDAPFIGLTYDNLTLLWAHLGEKNNALENILAAEKTFKEAGYLKTANLVRLNSYSIRILKENSNSLRNEIKEDLKKIETQKDSSTFIYLSTVLSKSYLINNQPDKAYSHLNNALEYINNYHPHKTSRKADVLYNLGRLFYSKNNYKQAENYLKTALPYIKQANMLTYESQTYLMLSNIYGKYEKNDLAYKYLQQSVILKDSLNIMNKMVEVQRVKNHWELTSYQQQLKISEQNAEIKRINYLLILSILIVILLAIVFILFYINKKKKLKELEIQKLDQQLKNKEMSSQLEKIEMEKQMEEKEREIATSQLLISEKNKMLEQLLETFNPLYKSKDISEKIWRKMKLFVSANHNKENSWEKSKFHFEKVHPDFFKKLKEQFPLLTENELRLSAYIRIGMRTKDIAEMLSIDHKSVITNRYHLKKKLELNKDQTLDDFIRNL